MLKKAKLENGKIYEIFLQGYKEEINGGQAYYNNGKFYEDEKFTIEIGTVPGYEYKIVDWLPVNFFIKKNIEMAFTDEYGQGRYEGYFDGKKYIAYNGEVIEFPFTKTYKYRLGPLASLLSEIAKKIKVDFIEHVPNWILFRGKKPSRSYLLLNNFL